jgi:hypothetical protein
MIKKKPSTIFVKQHPRHVAVSAKNPKSITIVDPHERRVNLNILDLNTLSNILKEYNRKGIVLPAKGKLQIPSEDLFDDCIAVWVDYFNKKLNLNSPIDPDMIKALIASESSFKPLATNKTATGLTQITTATLKILLNQKGEVKDYLFKGLQKKNLNDPNVSIALGVRWIAYKKVYEDKLLNRNATSDEVIQLYKGILNDKSEKASEIMKNYREMYGKLKGK